MDTRVAVISIIVEDSDSKPSTSFFMMPAITSLAVWASRTAKKESASSASPLMPHRISSVHFPEKSAV